MCSEKMIIFLHDITPENLFHKYDHKSNPTIQSYGDTECYSMTTCPLVGKYGKVAPPSRNHSDSCIWPRPQTELR